MPATGLLVGVPSAGCLVLAALAARWALRRATAGSRTDSALVGSGLMTGGSPADAGTVLTLL
ncbi:hypothetical protein AB0C93_31850 [Streptomyces sp. NPDC048518]|uniref:hypothetical protein n=1 Tax=Streptomyces sp. NPDC048518 TaxID=3155029 RepID=UPI0033C62123